MKKIDVPDLSVIVDGLLWQIVYKYTVAPSTIIIFCYFSCHSRIQALDSGLFLLFIQERRFLLRSMKSKAYSRQAGECGVNICRDWWVKRPKIMGILNIKFQIRRHVAVEDLFLIIINK